MNGVQMRISETSTHVRARRHTANLSAPQMPDYLCRLRAGILVSTVPLVLGSCSSCEVPREPVLPADISGRWVGSYTLYDGAGRPLTDSLWLTIESDRETLSGEGVRKRMLPDMPPMETMIEIGGSVVVNTFRLEMTDVDTRSRATYSGKVEGDTLSGNISIDGAVMGDLKMVGHRR